MSWTPGPLKYWLELNDSGTWGDDPDGPEGTPTVRSTDINLDGSWNLDEVAVRSVPPAELKSKRLRRGDLVVVKSSGSADHLGKTAIVTEELENLRACFANFVQRLRPGVRAEPRFVWYLLNSRRAAAEMEVLGNTTTGLRNLNGSIIGSVTFPGPPLEQQRAIADFLDTETARIDALIAKKRRMIDLLGERVVAQRSRLVLRGLDPVRGGGAQAMPGSWGVAALGVLIALHRGFDLPLESREAGPVPIVSSGGISGTHAGAMCHPPGVVTGRYGTIGSVFFLEEPYWPLNTTLFVSDFRTNDPRWVYHLLSALPLDFDAEKSAVTGINRNVIGGLRVPRPPVQEQRDIATAVDACVDHRNRIAVPLQQQVQLLEEHRQALITAAVTGELKVPGLAA